MGLVDACEQATHGVEDDLRGEVERVVMKEEEDGVRVRRRKEGEGRRGTGQGQSVWGGPVFFVFWSNEKGNKVESGPSDNWYAKVRVSRRKREKARQGQSTADCDAWVLAWPGRMVSLC